eukprot:jgi/Tetstr1/460251/TSEL_005552.t1
MGRRNSKRRIPQGKEGWIAAKGTWEEVSKRELRELIDADSDAEEIVAGVVEGNPSDDSRSDGDSEGDAVARDDFSTGTSAAVQQGASAAPTNWAACAKALVG